MTDEQRKALAAFRGTVGSMWVRCGDPVFAELEDAGLVKLDRKTKEWPAWHAVLTDAGRTVLAEQEGRDG